MSFKKLFRRVNTYSYKWDCPRLEKRPRSLLPFSVADSDYPTARAIIGALRKRCRHGAFGYTYIDDSMYDIITSWVKRRYRYQIKPEWILTSPGVVTALYWVVHAYTSPGDTVVIQPPVYYPFYRVVEAAGRNLALSPLLDRGSAYDIDFADLESKFKDGAKMMILCSPHNPVGRVWSRSELDRLIRLARKYNVLIVSDEIHCDIIMPEKDFVSVGEYIEEYRNVVILFAPSKTFNLAGLKLSFIIVPDTKRRKHLNFVFSDNFVGAANPLSLTAARAAYTKADKWLNRQIMHIENNIRYFTRFFKKNIPEAVLYNVEGTYLIWIKISFLGKKADSIARELIAYGISVNPGSMYGTDYDEFLRFNVACSRRQLKEGLIRFNRYVEDKKNKGAPKRKF